MIFARVLTRSLHVCPPKCSATQVASTPDLGSNSKETRRNTIPISSQKTAQQVDCVKEVIDILHDRLIHLIAVAAMNQCLNEI